MFKKVRNYFVLCTVAILSAFALTACGDDDDDNEPGGGSSSTGKNGIVGEWNMTSSKGWAKVNGQIVEEWDDDLEDEEYTIWEFKNDGKLYIWEYGELEERMSYKYTGSKLTITYYDWDDDDEPIEVSETADCKINGNKMVLNVTEVDSEDGVVYTIYNEITFTRVVK